MPIGIENGNFEREDLIGPSVSQLDEGSLEWWVSLGIVDVFQASAIYHHIRRYGWPRSEMEWNVIQGLDSTSIYNVQHTPVLRTLAFKRKSRRYRIRQKLRLRYGRILEKQQAYLLDPNEKPSTAFLGNPDRYWFRYQIEEKGHWRMQVAGEKDPGEPLIRGVGFDHWSGNFSWNGKGVLRQIVLGDFHFEYGQGAALWTSLRLGAGTMASQKLLFGRGISPYSGAVETNVLRGIATKFQLGNRHQFETFYSSRKIDANLVDGVIRSFPSTGYHRTRTELATKNRVQLHQFGMSYTFRHESIRLGLLIHRMKVEFPMIDLISIKPREKAISQEVQTISLEFLLPKKKNIWFGEFALRHHSYHLFIGWQWKPAAAWQTAIALRHQEIGFYHRMAPFVDPSHRNGLTRIELGIAWQGIRNINIQYWLNTTEYLGFSSINQLNNSQFSQSIRMSGKLARLTGWELFYRNNQRSDGFDEELNSQTQSIVNQIRLSINHSLSKNWRFSWKLVSNEVKSDQNERGSAFSQDVIFTSNSEKWRFTFRWLPFKTEGFNSRITFYEPEVLGALAFPFFQGNGHRLVALCRYKFSRDLKVEAKWGHTQYFYADFVGTGNTQSRGPYRNELKFQFSFSW